MRRRAAERGAVTSTILGFANSTWAGVAWEVRRLPQGSCHRDSAAVRTGLKGGTKIPPGPGCEKHPSGSEEWPGDGYKTPRWSAGWRAALRKGRNAHLRTVSMMFRCANRRFAPSLYGETEEKDRRCAPASLEWGRGAMAFIPPPRAGEGGRENVAMALAVAHRGHDGGHGAPRPPLPTLVPRKRTRSVAV